MIKRALEQESWTVVEAVNGRAGLERALERPPDLVLLDLIMPEMDGFEFLHEFRLRERLREIPVVVLTAKDLTQDERTRLNGAVQRVLAKGAHTRDELLATIRDLVVTSRPRAAQAAPDAAGASNSPPAIR